MNYSNMESQLSGDYRDVFQKVQLYVNLSGINDNIADEQLLDLYDLLMAAQSGKQPVKKVVGDDVEKFCKDYFRDYSKMDHVKEMFRRIYRLAICALFLEGIFYLADEEYALPHLLTAKTDVSAYLGGIGVGILISLIGERVLLPLGLRRRKSGNMLYYFVYIVLFIVFLTVSVHFWDKEDLFIPLFPFLVVLISYIALYLLVRSVWRLRHYGTLRDVKRAELKEIDKYYGQYVDRDLEDIYLKGWQKRYRRLSRMKGMTPEEFYQLLQKEEKQEAVIERFSPWAYVLIVIVCTLLAAKDSTWYDLLILAGILAAAEFGIYWFFKKISAENAKTRTQLLEECERSGMDILSFIDTKRKEK